MNNKLAIVNQDVESFLVDARDSVGTLFNEPADLASFENSAKMQIAENEDIIKAICHSIESARSVRDALIAAAVSGLSLNPALQEGYMRVSFRKKTGQYEASFIPMKNGIVRTANDAGIMVTHDIVFEHDHFEITKTLRGDDVCHQPARTNRGDIQGYYAGAIFQNGLSLVKYMDVEQIKHHMSKYGGSTNEYSAWGKSFHGMALKTVVKAVLGMNKSNKKLAALLVTDDTRAAGDIKQTSVLASRIKEQNALPAHDSELYGDAENVEWVDSTPAEPEDPPVDYEPENGGDSF